MSMKLILASASPRRREIMKQLFKDNFKIVENCYEEDNTLDVKPSELVRIHAREKARSVDAEGIIIAADSVVALGDKAIGKPIDKQEAIEILKKISGKEINVYTGVTVKSSEAESTEVEKTIVKVKDLSEEEIKKYVDSGEPMDRAGAFAIDGKGAVFIENINGCFYNVAGLPVHRLSIMLQNLKINILDY